MSQKIRVLIADDHSHEREGFKLLLSFVDFVEVIGEADSAQNTVQQALNARPDVILLDLTWYKDRTAGIEAIRQIKAQAPAIKILAATAYHDLIEQARQAGADLAVDKDSLSNKMMLGNRIRDAYTAHSFAPAHPPLIESLTEREQTVLKWVARGETDYAIAHRLEIGVSTAKKHVSSIIGKLGVNNRSAAIAVAYERGILKQSVFDEDADDGRWTIDDGR